MWLLKGIFQEDVEQTTQPVYQKNQRACMKTTKQYASDPFDNSTIETGDALINNMKEEEMGDHHNNRKTCTPPCLVNANQVAHQLLINSRGTMFIKQKRHALPPNTEVGDPMVYPYRRVQKKHRCFEEQGCWN